MKNLIRFLFIVLVLNIPMTQAFVEFHTHFGSSNGSPGDFNDAYYKTKTGPELTKQNFLGFDAIARFGAFPLRLGLRYESLGEKSSAYGQKVVMTGSRFSGVLNFRFINLKQYLGVIGTYGFSHNLQIDFKDQDEVYTSSSGKSSSIGIEGGVKFGPLRLGAEIGQLFLVYNNLKNKAGSSITANGHKIGEIDLSAPYYKLIVGLGF